MACGEGTEQNGRSLLSPGPVRPSGPTGTPGSSGPTSPGPTGLPTGGDDTLYGEACTGAGDLIVDSSAPRASEEIPEVDGAQLSIALSHTTPDGPSTHLYLSSSGPSGASTEQFDGGVGESHTLLAGTITIRSVCANELRVEVTAEEQQEWDTTPAEVGLAREDTGGMRFLGHIIVTGLALWVTALILPGMHLGDDSAAVLTQVLTIGAIALILALVNTIVKPILSLLTLPITCLTLGLFQLVVNTLMLLLAGWVSGLFGLALEFDSFWWALGAGLIIGILSAIVEAVTGLGERREAE